MSDERAVVGTATDLAALVETIKAAGAEVGSDTLDAMMRDLIVRVEGQVARSREERRAAKLNEILAKVKDDILSVVREGESFAVMVLPQERTEEGKELPHRFSVQFTMSGGSSKFSTVPTGRDKRGEPVTVTWGREQGGKKPGQVETFPSMRKALEEMARVAGKPVPPGHYNAGVYIPRFAEEIGASWKRGE